MNKVLLALFALLMGINSVWAQQFSAVNADGKTIYYNITDATNHEVEVYESPSDNRYSGAINIPASVEYNGVTYSVTTIKNRAFYDCRGLTSVTIPNSVTTIGNHAFWGCSGLTSVTIPNSVTTIGDLAFVFCNSLTSVTIPNSVTAIGNVAFYGVSCAIIIEATNPPTLGEWSFGDNSEIPIYVPDNSVNAYRNHPTWSFYTNIISSDLLFEVANSDGKMIRYGVIDEVNHYVEVLPSSYSGDINIPSTVDHNGVTYSVTTIGNFAFEDCSGLTSVTIPNSVTTIGNDAFHGCSGLTSVTIPNSVTTIGNFAFLWCSGLTSVMIGNSVTTIGGSAFAGCSGLTSVIIPNSVTTIGNGAFSWCSGLTSITIPNSVTTIGERAFYECSGLTSIVIPNSVTTIGDEAFNSCYGLTSVTIPNSVTTIGDDAFSYCRLIVVEATTPPTLGERSLGWNSEIPIYVPNNSVNAYRNNPTWSYYTNIKSRDSLFEEANSDGKMIRYGVIDEVNHYIEVTYGSSRYSGDINIPSMVNHNGGAYTVTGIRNHAFENCSSLTSVTIPNSVTTIGEGAFYECSGCHSIFVNAINPPILVEYYPGWDYSIPIYVPNNSVNTYRNNDYWGYYNIRSMESFFEVANSDGKIISYYVIDEVNHYVEVTNGSYSENINIPSMVNHNGITYSVTTIGENAFSSCSALTSVTIPNSVTTIGYRAFKGCSGLTSVTIGSSVTTIGDYAFDECSSLTSVTIPNSVTTIGERAFEYCSGLTSVTLPNRLDTIRRGTFLGCNVLTSIVIPNSVTVIEDGEDWGVFEYCSSLVSITIGDSVKTIGSSAFNGCSGLTSVTIPNSVTTIGRSAFEDCSGLTSVTIPNSVTTIGDFAFEGCSGLTSVMIPNSVTTIGRSAFEDCSGLTSIMLPISLDTIDGGAFVNDTNIHTVYWNAKNVKFYGLNRYDNDFLNPFNKCKKIYEEWEGGSSVQAIYSAGLIPSVIFGDSVRRIPDSAFADFVSLDTVVIGKSVTLIGKNAFGGCSGMDMLRVKAMVPPLMSQSTFEGVPSTIPVYVPCASLDAYLYNPEWSYFTNIQCDPNTSEYTVTVMSNNEVWGSVAGGGYYAQDSVAVLTATANEGYRFVSWNDGNTENPRSVVVAQDSMFTASFELIPIIPEYTITVMSNNEARGSVSGSGNYEEGSTVMISAVANEGYRFDCWNDSAVVNPRSVVATNNSVYIATFVSDITQIDTVVVHDTTIVRDTIVNNIHDTTIVRDTIVNTIYDTIVNTVYDTIINTVHDTTIVRDTVVNMVHDTIVNTVHDTIINTVHDTIINTVYDTIINTVHDTVMVEETYYNLLVSSANDTKGMGIGSGSYPEGCEVWIVGLPKEGEKFAGWNDGNMDNPRKIVISEESCSATYIANFDHVGIEESPAVREISVYPNPTTGEIKISSDDVQHVDVYDAVGKKVAQFDNQNRYDLSQLASGNYTLMITIPEGTAIRRVIKK